MGQINIITCKMVAVVNETQECKFHFLAYFKMDVAWGYIWLYPYFSQVNLSGFKFLIQQLFKKQQYANLILDL